MVKRIGNVAVGIRVGDSGNNETAVGCLADRGSCIFLISADRSLPFDSSGVAELHYPGIFDIDISMMSSNVAVF
ncbi:hypothetical protein D3C83_67560 [compost metagenome]